MKNLYLVSLVELVEHEVPVLARSKVKAKEEAIKHRCDRTAIACHELDIENVELANEDVNREQLLIKAKSLRSSP
jgi:hypothetical protein